MRDTTEYTINQLIYEHEVVLYGFLVNLAKVRFRNRYEAVTVFEHKRRICVASERRCA
jgi:hypothetical protein